MTIKSLTKELTKLSNDYKKELNKLFNKDHTANKDCAKKLDGYLFCMEMIVGDLREMGYDITKVYHLLPNPMFKE